MSQCLSREVVMTKLVHAFSWRAWQYICAYHALHEQQHSSNDSTSESKITVPLIEKLVKWYITHWAVIDFHNRFVAATVKIEEEGTSEINK
jgi:ribosome-associated toxin RatA of RatAB toxin-antitoxin module